MWYKWRTFSDCANDTLVLVLVWCLCSQRFVSSMRIRVWTIHLLFSEMVWLSTKRSAEKNIFAWVISHKRYVFSDIFWYGELNILSDWPFFCIQRGLCHQWGYILETIESCCVEYVCCQHRHAKTNFAKKILGLNFFLQKLIFAIFLWWIWMQIHWFAINFIRILVNFFFVWWIWMKIHWFWRNFIRILHTKKKSSGFW